LPKGLGDRDKLILLLMQKVQRLRGLPMLEQSEALFDLETWNDVLSVVPTAELVNTFKHLCTYHDFSLPFAVSALRRAYLDLKPEKETAKVFPGSACPLLCSLGFHIVAQWRDNRWNTAARGCVCAEAPAALRSSVPILDAGYICGSSGVWARPVDLITHGDYLGQFAKWFREQSNDVSIEPLETDEKESEVA